MTSIAIKIIASGNGFRIEGHGRTYATARNVLNAAREIGRVEQVKALSPPIREIYDLPFHERQARLSRIFPNPFDKTVGIIALARLNNEPIPEVTIDDAALTVSGAEHPDVTATQADNRRKYASRKRRAERQREQATA